MDKPRSKRPGVLKIDKDNFPDINTKECLSAREFQHKKVKINNPGFFSPNPFKSFEETWQDLKIRPVIIKKDRYVVNMQPKVSGFTIQLPEISVDGMLKFNKYYFPPINQARNNKLINENANSFGVLRFSSEGSLQNKTKKAFLENRKSQKPEIKLESHDISFGRLGESSSKMNPFLSFNEFNL